MNILDQSLEFIYAIGPLGCVFLVLPLLFFELPRYTLLYFVSGFVSRAQPKPMEPIQFEYSAVIPGHNEAHKIRDCVISLREQSMPPSEILLVSDGSTDMMRQQLAALYEEGLVDGTHHVDLRGGKAAALNLVSRYAKQDFIVQVDSDCSFDRHACRRLLEPFMNERVGIVSGNVVPRNDRDNLLTSMQAIEYMISISLGRQASDMLNQVSIASGAFTAYRKTALDDTYGLDAGPGEDLDITLKMRQRTWHTRFAPEAICYTDVPNTWASLTRQRMRWERDAIGVRFRKYSDVINPIDRRFNPSEALHQFEFFLFNIFAAAVTPIYFLFVWFWFEESALIVLCASYLFLILHDLVVFNLAAYVNPRLNLFRHVLLLPLYSLYYILFMRNLRLYAYFDEWTFRSSLKNNFVPGKVRKYIEAHL